MSKRTKKILKISTMPSQLLLLSNFWTHAVTVKGRIHRHHSITQRHVCGVSVLSLPLGNSILSSSLCVLLLLFSVVQQTLLSLEGRWSAILATCGMPLHGMAHVVISGKLCNVHRSEVFEE
jgi:hypothetical protein